MKPYGFLATIFIMTVIVIPIISSCSSSKDIYRNPYQTQINPSAISGSFNDNQPGNTEQPDWIYAVSKDFIVGYGSGKDITEAKNAAMNDIKSFIVKSLGESGNVVEINFVSNTATGRNNAESQETYIMKNQFESKFKPVINISIDRFEDYHYERGADLSRYFIKYRLDAAELERIRNEYDASVHRSNLAIQKSHRTVDSLINFEVDSQIESIIERYNAILDYYYSNNLDERDSISLKRGIQNIQAYLNTLQIRILEHSEGNFIRFGLFNGPIKVRTQVKPDIISSGIIEGSLVKKDDLWELRYKNIEDLQTGGYVELTYSLPHGTVMSKVIIPKASISPAIEVIGKLQFSEIQKNAWNGMVSRLTIFMNINYNGNYASSINSLELVLHSNIGSQPAFYVDNLKFILSPGLNHLVEDLKVDLPMRLFFTRELYCDLTLYYQSDKGLEKLRINNIPVTINN